MITIVSGFGRCGSSMLMQMLAAGGMKCSGKWPSFEDTRATRSLPHDIGWLDEYHGRAVKILAPGFFLPLGLCFDARGIWLDRDPKEQAKSWAKIQRRVGSDVPRSKIHEQRRLFVNQRRKHLDRLKFVTKDKPLILRYDTILKMPHKAAETVKQFLGVRLDIDKMTEQVVSRKPQCYPGFMESEMVEHAKTLQGHRRAETAE